MKSFITNKELVGCRFVKLTSGLENTTSANDNIVGVSDTVNKKAGQMADIAISGEMAVLEAGAAFNAGDSLTSDANGCAIKAKNGDNIGAIAYQSAEAKGDCVMAVVQLQRTIKVESLEENGNDGEQ